MAKKQKKVVDANLSNAGDDFHILWTIQKSLELLNNDDDGLKAIALEGLVTRDTAYVDPYGDVCLGVDLSEYFGGENFSSANRVVISQLKYSTLHSAEEWTTSKICAGKKAKYKGSIIDRLAVFFKRHLNTYNRQDVVDRISLKLVSNRPASLKLTKALEDFKNAVHIAPGISFTRAFNTLGRREKKEIEIIKVCSGFNGQNLIDFLCALDFSDCNTDSRLDQRKNLLSHVNALGSGDAVKQYESLHKLVWDKMMPESAHANELTITHVLISFGLSDWIDLFPAQPKFEKTLNTVHRTQGDEIITLLKSSSDKIFYLHAGAGFGKSTMIKQLLEHHDDQLTFIGFDCYGLGTYLDPEDGRHKPKKAFVQLSNMLAMAVETPFLVNRSLDNDFALEQFAKRLELAVKALRRNDPAAVLCLVIDAADNSIRAAQESQTDSFLKYLLAMNLPEGCKILLSLRTERIPSLNLPASAKEIPLATFSTLETSALLALHDITLTSEQVEEFMQLTRDTPRVMSYILQLPGAFDFNLMQLKPSGKSLTDIFKIQIRFSEGKVGSADAVRRFLTQLITMPRPVPYKGLQKVAALSDQELDDLTTDLWHGLVLEKHRFSFRDEDLENFLRTEYPATQADHERIAAVFLEDAASDDYSSIHLGSTLYRAGKIETLQSIVVDKAYLDVPLDPIRNKETFIERTRLAMKAASGDLSRTTFLKLQTIAAESTKTNKILEEILLNNPELASLHADVETYQRLYFQAGNPAWFGRAHFRSAATFSRKGESTLVQRHLNKAISWLEFRNTLRDDERHHYELEPEDVAYGAEAILRTSGPETCAKWLSRWNPPFAYKAIRSLITLLLETSTTDEVHEWVRAVTMPIDVKLSIVEIFFKHGLKPPFNIAEVVDEANILFRIKSKFNFSFKESLLTFVECALSQGIAYSKVSPLMTLIEVEVPTHTPNFYGASYGNKPADRRLVDALMKLAAIQHVVNNEKIDIKAYYPARMVKALASEKYEERSDGESEKIKLDKIYGHALAVFVTRAKFLFKPSGITDPVAEVKNVTQRLQNDYELSYRLHDSNDLLLFLSMRLMDVIRFSNNAALIEVIRAGFAQERYSNLNLYLQLADTLSVSRIFDEHTTRILALAETAIESHPKAASEYIGQYTSASVIASRFSLPLGKHFFDKMVNASEKIDLDAQDQIRVFNTLLTSTDVPRNPELAYNYARYVEYCGEHLRNWDNFPWEAGFEGITKLHLATATTTMCRWEHRNIRPYHYYVIEIVEALLRQNIIDHRIAASLLPLNPDHWRHQQSLINLILDRFDADHDHVGKTEFVKILFTELKINADPMYKFYSDTLDYLKGGKFLDGNVVKELEHYQASYHSLQSPQEKTIAKTEERVATESDDQYQKLASTVDPVDPRQIENFFSSLGKLSEHGHVREYYAFDLLVHRVTPVKRTGYLTALCELNERITYYSAFESHLAEILKAWELDPAVIRWKKESFPKVLRALFVFFTSHDYLSIDSFDRLLEIFGATREDAARELVTIIPDQLDRLNSNLLYALLELTATGMANVDRLTFTEWLIKRWSGRIEQNFGEGIFESTYVPPSDSTALVAEMLRFFLSHPEKAVRWRAAHSIKRLVESDRTAIIGQLLKERNTVTCHPFQGKNIPFFWISAHLYLLVAIDRTCVDHPDRIKQFAPVLFDELKNDKLPHALLKYYLKSICLRLRKADPKLFTAKQNALIDKTLIGKTVRVKTRDRKRRGFGRRDDGKTKFDFDTLDTLPYWFGPLGDCFGVSDQDVAILADKYIHQYWGYTGNINEDNMFKHYDYEKRSNRKGGSSQVEDLKHYYEFHSMHCAAIELLNTHTVKLEKHDEPDGYGTFGGWIRDWTTAWPDNWLADWRDPTPIMQRFRIQDSTKDRDWLWNVGLQDFDQVINLNGEDKLRPDYLFVYGDHTIHYYKDYESTHVASALVNPETAPALLRATQTTRTHHFHFPYEKQENDEYNNDGPTDDRFSLKGWIQNINGEERGGELDVTDERYANIGKYRMTVGEKFLKWSKAKLSEDYRYATDPKNPENVLAIYEAWNEQSERTRYESFYSSGHRVLVKKSSLLKFLQAINKCLILSCEIRRHMEYKEFKEHLDPNQLIYLIYPDGKVSTIFRDVSIR